jgi:hypothetical protein
VGFGHEYAADGRHPTATGHPRRKLNPLIGPPPCTDPGRAVRTMVAKFRTTPKTSTCSISRPLGRVCHAGVLGTYRFIVRAPTSRMLRLPRNLRRPFHDHQAAGSLVDSRFALCGFSRVGSGDQHCRASAIAPPQSGATGESDRGAPAEYSWAILRCIRYRIRPITFRDGVAWSCRGHFARERSSSRRARRHTQTGRSSAGDGSTDMTSGPDLRSPPHPIDVIGRSGRASRCWFYRQQPTLRPHTRSW